MDTAWLIGLIVASVCGVALTIVRLPGTWLVVLSAGVYSWHTDWSRPGWGILGVLIALAVLAEVLEFAASMVTARKAGASGRAMWCGVVGGFAGMLVFTIPLPLVGTIIGGALGCFLGALIGELTARKDLAQGARVGLFAAVGQVLGTMVKTMIALIMAGTAVATAILGGGP